MSPSASPAYCLNCGRPALDLGPSFEPRVRIVDCQPVAKNGRQVFGGCGHGLGMTDPDSVRGFIIDRRRLAVERAHERDHANRPIPSKCWRCRKEATDRKVASHAV